MCFPYVELIIPNVAFESVWWPSTEGPIWFWERPFWAAVVAAPMRNEWLEKLNYFRVAAESYSKFRKWEGAGWIFFYFF